MCEGACRMEKTVKDLMKMFRSSIRFLIALQIVYVVNGQTVSVRLAGTGATAFQGRVEVLYNGEWGTICDDKFDNKATNVICNMLGFTNGGTPVNSSVFGAGTGRIWMDEVTCSGIEPSIDVCTFNGWGVSDCDHTEDVGVICVNTLTSVSPASSTTKSPANVQPTNCSVASDVVRLIGPTDRPGVGFVEVQRNGNWYSICDDFWDLNDAKVICGMLCYDTSLTTAGLDQSLNYIKDNVSSTILLDNVNCDGTESNIFSCSHRGFEVHDCQVGEYASVQCVPVPPTGTKAPEPILQCEDEMFTVSFSRSYDDRLEPKHLSIFYNYTGQCRLDKSTDTNYVTMKIPFTDCGTKETSNATHLMYVNTLFYNYTSLEQDIVRKNTYVIEVVCEFPRNKTVDEGGLQPQSQFVTQAAPGQFKINMQFYSDNNFQIALQLTKLLLGDLVVVGIELDTKDPNLQLIVPTCIATPTTDRNHNKRHTLFENNCVRDPTVRLRNQVNNTFVGFSFEAFKFIGYDAVYVHCTSVVCRTDEKTGMCDRTCTATEKRRKKRSTGQGSVAVFYISSPRMTFIRPTDSVEAPIQRDWDVTADSTLITSTKLTPTTENITRAAIQSSGRPVTTISTKTTQATTLPATKSVTSLTTRMPTTIIESTTTAKPTAKPTTRLPTTLPATTESSTQPLTVHVPSTSAVSKHTTKLPTTLPATTESSSQPLTVHVPSTSAVSKSSTWKTLVVRATTTPSHLPTSKLVDQLSTQPMIPTTDLPGTGDSSKNNSDVSVKPAASEEDTSQNILKKKLGEIYHAGLEDFDLTSGSRQRVQSSCVSLLVLSLIYFLNVIP